MARKSKTLYEQATTPAGEDLLHSGARTVGQLEAFAEHVRRSLPQYADNPYLAIRDACAMLAVRQFEANINTEREALRKQLTEELQSSAKSSV